MLVSIFSAVVAQDSTTAATPPCHFPVPSASSLAVGAAKSGPMPKVVVGLETAR